MFVRVAVCVVFASLAASFSASAQSPAWSRTYNGPSGASAFLGDGFIIGRSLAVDANGNAFATGATNAGGNADFLTTKIDGANGAIVWQKTFAGAAGKDDVPMSVAVDRSGNAIVAGLTRDASGNASIQVIKYAGANGAVAWQATFAGGSSSAAYVVATDASGNAILGAETNASGTSDLRVIKLAAANGSALWDVKYDGGGDDYLSDLGLDGSGNVVVAGISVNASGNQDFTILKLDAAKGVQLWKRTYDSGGDDQVFAVALDAAGNAFVTGSSSGATRDMVTLKLAAADGSVAWRKTLDGGKDDSGQAITVDATGNAIVAGQTQNAAGNFDFVTVKYAAADGGVAWQKTYDGGGDDWAYAVAVDGSGNAYVAGSTTSSGNRDWMVIAYASADGAMLLQSPYKGSAGQADDAYAIAPTADGAIVGGTVNEAGAQTGARVEKLSLAAGVSIDKTASITLASTANPSTVGQYLTFTGVVSGSSGTPTGSIVFRDNGTGIGGCLGVPMTNGWATCTIGNLTQGTHSMTAAYTGDGVYSALTSSTLPQVVNPAKPNTPSITLGSSVNPSTVGQVVEFTGVVSGNSGTPTGKLVFLDDSNVISGCAGLPMTNGQATCSPGNLTQGTHAMTAVYSGDSTYNGVNSSNLPQTVNAAKANTPSFTLGSSMNPSTAGQMVTFTAVLSGGAGTPTGNVVFRDNGITISGCGGLALTNGRVTCTPALNTVGTHSITGIYLGDGNYNGITSSVLPQTVQ